jgi:hydrogenase-4 component E
MISLLIISFGVTLIYLSIAERMSTYNMLIAVQGALLFAITYMELKNIDVWHLILILLETLIIKVIVLPYFIHRLLIRKHNNAVAMVVPGFVSLTVVSIIIFLSFLLSYLLHDNQIQVKYFTGAIAAIFTGLYLIIVHKNVFTHMMGYLTIENGIFLLSLAIGNEMPSTAWSLSVHWMWINSRI